MNRTTVDRRDFVAMLACASCVTGASAAADDAPFAIHKRRMPTGEDLNVLLPAVLGPFRRDPLLAGATLSADEDLTIDYRNGNDSVNMGLGKPGSAADAREAIKVSRDEAVASRISLRGERFSLQTEPAYFHVGDFIAWSRGQYFFYAKANSPATLARFMTLFPF